MSILCINCGSSTLKFDLIDPDGGKTQSRPASGVIERIGGETNLTLTVAGRSLAKRQVSAGHHGEALSEALAAFEEHGLLSGVHAAGHRVVHGGARFRQPVRIDDAVIEAIDAVSDLAPLHNRPALQAIAAARERLGHGLPMVATFDTAFYADLPAVAALYAIPRELSEKHAIRRYGFHGLAHRYMVQRFRELRPEIERPRLITLQLGNGCSATATLDGRPLDTSMGFTPLEGLIMGTRSGDLDPSLPSYLAQKEKLSSQAVESLLNTQSGLLGLSNISSDMRDVLEAAVGGNARAELAVDAFCYRATKYVGSYLAVLGGADAVIFGGGIGERSPEVRKAIASSLEWAGLRLDAAANDVGGGDRRISEGESLLEAWVVEVDEAAIIAQDVAACLDRPNPT